MSILVSIICITYNHEKYIMDALDSFLMQKTNIEYEIIIHDDASSDKTASIIRDYELKYPKLIKCIYQSENQYSKGKFDRIARSFVSKSQGKYLALCEGDDYWTDPYKLQKQVEILESNPLYTMCIHATEIVDVNGKSINDFIRPNVGNTTFCCEDMILGGAFFHTSSIFCRKQLMENIPQWFFESLGMQTSTALLLASYGDVYYIDEVMSIWRKETPGGFTVREFKNEKRRKIVFKKQIKTLDGFDLYTNKKYSKAINRKRLEYEIQIVRCKKKIRPLSLMLHPKYKLYIKNLKIYRKVKLILSYLFPRLYRLLGNSLKIFIK